MSELDEPIADPYLPAHTPPVRGYRLGRLSGVALGFAVPIAAGALLVAVDAPIRRDVALLTGVAVVFFVAWLGGIWPGLLAALLLGVLLGGPRSAVDFEPAVDPLSLFLFAAASLTGIGVIESQYRTQWRVAAARDRARIARRGEHAVRAELESIVAAIGDGIVVVEADGAISLMNKAAVEIFGQRHITLQALLAQFAPAADGADPAERLAGARPTTAEFLLDEGRRRIELSVFPVTEGEPRRRVVLIRDVTAARQRELLRDAFLSLLSHELRTPMTAIYAGATLMQRSGDKLDAATRAELRADIVFEADRLARLLDDLLVLTRVEEGVEVGHEPALLQHVVASVVTQERPAVRGATVEVVADPGLPPVTGDETGIRQVTHNLISNAVKYSPPGATIDVRVEHGDGEVQVRVLDRGPGLADEETARVFDAFYRAPNAQGTTSGIGIGLFVSRRLVEAMGGRMWAKRREGGGSEFGFALPEWPMEPEEPIEAGALDAGAAEGTVEASAMDLTAPAALADASHEA